MSATAGFVGSFALTLALLGVVVVSGRAARRRVHIPFVGAAVVSLLITIYFAEQLGEEYDLDAAGIIKPIHLTIAKLTVVAYLLPLVTGPMVIRNPARILWHRRVAYIVLVLTVLAAVTGTMMVLMAEPLALRAV